VKPDKKFIFAGVLLLLALTLVVVRLSPSSAPSANEVFAPVARSENRAVRNASTHQAPAQESRIGQAIPPDESASAELAVIPRDAAIEKMHDAAVTYDPAELPVIGPYLESPDPELRAAAVEAMIILGDSSAGPMLREAALKLTAPEEILKMQQAADYIELPPANLKKISELMKNRENPKPESRETEGE